jgi:hypothetical protein
MPPDVNKPNAPFLDQAPWETLRGSEDFGGFGHCKEPV